MGGVPSVGGLSKGSWILDPVFTRVSEKTMENSDKRDRGLNLTPPVYQFLAQNSLATGGP